MIEFLKNIRKQAQTIFNILFLHIYIFVYLYYFQNILYFSLLYNYFLF